MFVTYNNEKYIDRVVLKSRRVLFSRRNMDSGVEGLPDALLSYLEEISFVHVARVRDFHFDNSLLLVFVVRWHPKRPIHFTFHRTYYNRDIWEMIAEALEALSRESFTIKMIWLKDRLKQMSANAAPDVLEQYAHCYILRLINRLLMTEKSIITVHVRWIPLIADFERCKFLDWCPEGRDVVDFSLAASCIEMTWVRNYCTEGSNWTWSLMISSGGHLITYNLCTISFLSRYIATKKG
ncbi:hypothetical protein Ahy_A05g025755 [Arachis hypogaea]|uniref:Aminotransferase-like plant mobile domain-containing protein n=1 Tax=Arachis hypogaea TaxID=3818 RepID=A0A445D9D5_ARAHY|nr:hypothetical protein Ahy_A05g025755 [Arachis hypogaea]